MPRGIAVPEVRQRMFAALERLIVRDGTARVTSRAVTSEAGVAAGLLHTHFGNTDAFLGAYAVDRAFTISSATGSLADQVGLGQVVGNVCDVVCSIPAPVLVAVSRLYAARPDVAAQVCAVLGDRTAGLDAIETVVTDYLTAEQRGGRLAADAAPQAVALAVVGVTQRIALDDAPEGSLPDHLRIAVERLMAPIVVDAAAGSRQFSSGTGDP